MPNEPKPHHHIIAWVGVAIFLILIGTFWVMGLGDILGGTKLSPSVISDLQEEWNRISKQSQKNMLLMQQQNELQMSKYKIQQQLKEILLQSTDASALSADETENAVTSTED